MLYGVIALKCKEYDGAAAHERAELVEERPFAMNRVEAHDLRTRQARLAHAEHLKSLLQEALEDRALRSALHGVGLDDAEGSLGRHRFVSVSRPAESESECAPLIASPGVYARFLTGMPVDRGSVVGRF